MKRILSLLLAPVVLIFLVAMPAHAYVGRASDKMDAIIDDLHQHGYKSASEAIARLQQAVDMPGADAPLDQRLRFQTSILRLAMHGRHPQMLAQSIAVLERMATQENCTPCHFDALLGRAYQALDGPSLAQSKGLLDQAQRLLPAGDDERKEQLLMQQSAVTGRDGKFNKAIELSVAASYLAQSMGHVDVQLRLLAGMSGLNAYIGDLDRAESIAREALSRATAMNYVPVMAFASLGLSNAYSLKHDRPRQLVALNEALRLTEKAPESIETRLLSLNNLADYYLEQPGQEQRVLDFAGRADALARSANLDRYRPLPIANIGIALSRTGHASEGIDRLKHSYAIAEAHDMTRFLIPIATELVNVYENSGRYHDALIELHKVAKLQQKVTRAGREKAVLELQEKYAGERKSQEIRQLSAENAVRRAEVNAKTWQQRLWALLVAVLVLGSLLLGRMIRRARTVNNQLAVANASLAEQTAVDPLTGAYNRRHCQTLMTSLPGSVAKRRESDRDRPPVTGLMMLDVDFFKQVNDTYGHAAGDAVLVALVDRLRTLLRQEDVVARWGGEEFLLLLPHTPPEQLPAIARRVLQIIGEIAVVFETRSIPVTVSVGATCFPMFDGQTWETSLGIADDLMYQSKAGGRNRATCLIGISERGRHENFAANLLGAQAAGDVQVDIVPGPEAVADVLKAEMA